MDDEGNEIKLLELDELDSGDVFCHANVIDKKPIEYSVTAMLPTEIYGVSASDFLVLCKDLLYDFKRYNK